MHRWFAAFLTVLAAAAPLVAQSLYLPAAANARDAIADVGKVIILGALFAQVLRYRRLPTGAADHPGGCLR